jgi:formate C-acetyltransferase
MAFGMAGLSVVADSLSAIKYAKVRVSATTTGLITDYQTEGEFPCSATTTTASISSPCGWSDLHAPAAAARDVSRRRAHQSVLNDHVNVVYGKATATPRRPALGEPSRPGHPDARRDTHGIHASAASVAKIPYRDAADGISLTSSLADGPRPRRGDASPTSPASSTRSSAAPATT